MKQVIQSLSDGSTSVVDVPRPQVKSGHLLIRTHRSLISSGTERTLVDFGRANPIAKARKQPERVREVLSKMKTDGVATTVKAVQAKLNKPIPLGYCNVGHVIAVGEDVSGFSVGDRVISNGPHAEFVVAPKNLCAKVPDEVDSDAAAFCVLGAIGLQGVRLAAPTIGERFVVTGLGLVGLLTVQLLKAQGCRVLGLDYDAKRLGLARQFGAETVDLSCVDPVAAATQFSAGYGVDGVIITAATDSNEPMHQAATMCRQRGRIILVGVTGLTLSRNDFYEKELSFQVSCSYGPGRYDDSYEIAGNDYPIGFVRWTEQRNFEAILDLMASSDLTPLPLITHRHAIAAAAAAYQDVVSDKKAIGMLLDYPEPEYTESDASATCLTLSSSANDSEWGKRKIALPDGKKTVVGVIGAGNFAVRNTLPALKRRGIRLKTIASRGGLDARIAADEFGFEQCSSDAESILADSEINCVFVLTRHDSHAALACEALRAGKHVFVEKPLAISDEQLAEVEATYREISKSSRDVPHLMVGFNRRFAPQVSTMKGLLASEVNPMSIIITVNAGHIPQKSWVQNQQAGGGRIVGEGCHFIDLFAFLAGSPIADITSCLLENRLQPNAPRDTVSISLKSQNGDIGVIHYLSNGHKGFPKERVEVFCDGKILQLDNFRRLKGFGFGKLKGSYLATQNKGHREAVDAFVSAIEDGTESPISFGELLNVSKATLMADRQSKLIPVYMRIRLRHRRCCSIRCLLTYMKYAPPAPHSRLPEWRALTHLNTGMRAPS